MIYVLWFLLGILAYFNKNSKFVTLLITLFILVVFSFSDSIPDLQAYQELYDYGIPHVKEPLYVYLNVLFKDIGISFYLFRFVIVFFALSLIISTIYRYSPYPTFVLYLYTIYPMSIDVVQIRSFIAYAIVFFAFRFLVDFHKEKKVKYILFFFVLIGIATTLHYSCILYSILGLLFFNFGNHKKLFFVLLPLFFILMTSNMNKIVPYVVNILGWGKISNWIDSGKVYGIIHVVRLILSRGLPLLLIVFVTFLKKSAFLKSEKLLDVNIFGSKCIYDKNFKGKMGDCPSQFYEVFVNRLLFASVFLIFLFVFWEIHISTMYERLNRLGLLFSYVLISRQIFCLEIKNKFITHLLLLIMAALCFCSVMFFMENYPGYYFFDAVFRQVMENNTLF